MKTTINQSHRNSVVSYLFFGIAATVFTLSIFSSFYYNSEENANLYKDLSLLTSTRMTKPVSATITETSPLNLRELIADGEAIMAVETWMTQPFDVTPVTSAPAVTTIPHYEPAIEVESWMSDLNSWTTVSDAIYQEAELAVESWMVNTDEWTVFSQVSPFADAEFATETLYVEDWMLSLDSWSPVANNAEFTEAPLRVESWMLDSDKWLADK